MGSGAAADRICVGAFLNYLGPDSVESLDRRVVVVPPTYEVWRNPRGPNVPIAV